MRTSIRISSPTPRRLSSAPAGSDEKCDAIRRLGAKAINYRNGDFTDAVVELTGTRGVDIVLDIMGASYLDSNINVLAQKGRLILVGFLSGYLAEKVDLRTIARKQLTISGSTMRPRTNAEKAAIADDLRTHVWPALSAGRCLPLIDSVFPLAQVADAHRKMEESHHIGKIVLSVAH
jgi:NADPH:quinone reductase-like Zn-dependent oxidoreductase